MKLGLAALCLASVAGLGAFAGLGALAGCGARQGGAHADKSAAADVVVVGTCLDAASGEKLSGVKIEAPDGKSAVSGRDGRFEIRGLKAGQDGVVTASLADGRRASVPLRPLTAGTLEVVLQLTAER